MKDPNHKQRRGKPNVYCPGFLTKGWYSGTHPDRYYEPFIINDTELLPSRFKPFITKHKASFSVQNDNRYRYLAVDINDLNYLKVFLAIYVTNCWSGLSSWFLNGYHKKMFPVHVLLFIAYIYFVYCVYIYLYLQK